MRNKPFWFNIRRKSPQKIFWMTVLLLLVPTSSWAVDKQNPKLPDLQIKAKGRAPHSSLMIKKSSLVPAFQIHKNAGQPLPRLDIGEETEFEFAPVSLPNLEKPILHSTNSSETAPGRSPHFQLPSPKTHDTQMQKLKIIPVTPPKAFVSDKSIQQIPEVKGLKELTDPEVVTPEPKPMAIIDFKSLDYKLLEGLIFLEAQKNYDIALAYFSELLEDKVLGDEARYHYARAARERGLNTEVRATLLQVAKSSKSKEWKLLATQALAENIDLFDVADLKEIDPLVVSQDVDIAENDAYNFYRAKYYLELGHLGQVEDALRSIPEKSKYYNDSLLISALFNYRQGKLELAEAPLQELLKLASPEDSVRSVGAMTLARIQFQKAKYKEAFQTYLQVHKSHALWLQAMVEQAWAQILNQDYEGAAGNMFSLHTDYFKNAYNPESYLVRTIGYLNLCQFGDASQALNNLGKRYGPTYGRLEAFGQTKKDSNLYETVRQLLKNPNLREVDGLPRSFIIELARHPSFINIQKHLNSFEDEISNFNKVTINLIQREKDLLKNQIELSKALSTNRSAQTAKNIEPTRLNALVKEALQMEKQLFTNKFEYKNVNGARSQVKIAREKAAARLEEEKGVLRGEIAKVLQKRFKEISSNLKAFLDQTEVLNYEIYSGAGEQMRFQAAGGEVNQKERPQLMPEKDKRTTWKFKGEIWEDEIGHFRSSLKSVCPPGDNKVSANNGNGA